MKTEAFDISTTHRAHMVALDSLRGIAALFVVLLHFEPAPVIRNLFANAFLMVDLFFVLSGFAISYAYHDRLQTLVQVRRFLWLRFWRLYPLHFALLTYFVAVELAKPVAGLFVPVHHAAFSLGGWRDVAANLLLLQSFNLTNSVSFNPPSWSISAEFYVYILFACVALLLRRRLGVPWAALLICSGAVAVLVLFDPQMGRTFDHGWVRGLAGFFAGVLTFGAYQVLHRRVGHAFDIGPAALLALAMLAAFILFKPSGAYTNIAILPLSCLLILLVALSAPAGVIRILGSPPLRWLGVISYSIYMVHAAAGFALAYLVKTTMPGAHSLLTQTGLALVDMAVVIAVASVTFLCLERPVRAWSRK